jgi:uncharacterized protein (DUF1684 family)
MLNMLKKGSFLVVLSIAAVTGLQAQSKKENAAYITEIKDWDASRISTLKSANGWVNLAGLFWLKPGENKFGSESGNELEFKHPQFPPMLGKFILWDKEVIWESAPDQEVFEKGDKVSSVVQFNLDSVQSVQLAYKTFRWTIIKRGELVGVRFRDLAHPHLNTFKQINRYRINQNWRVEARLEASMIPSVAITNVLGQTSMQRSPGKVVFELQGKTYKLDAVDEGDDNLFILFGDETNDIETYPTGRFMYIPKPDAEGKTVIDFNKAFNPPCAFSAFATCPIPPKQNILPLKVTAGEKKVHLD